MTTPEDPDSDSGPGSGPPERASGTDPQAPAEDAAQAALARARAAARAKGLRPGAPPRRRRKDIPTDARTAKDGRDPRLLGEEVEAFVAERGWGSEVAVGSVIGRWEAIVGGDIAAHARPVEFRDGVLTVRAESTAWATQLRLLTSSLLRRLAEDVGEGVVAELRVVGPSAPSWSRGARRSPDGRGPRDTYG